jgi:hypothetical protein
MSPEPKVPLRYEPHLIWHWPQKPVFGLQVKPMKHGTFAILCPIELAYPSSRGNPCKAQTLSLGLAIRPIKSQLS